MLGDDDGIVATKLQQGSSQAFPHCLAHLLAHAGGACSRYQRNSWVLGQQSTNRGISNDQVGNPFRQTVLGKYFSYNVLAGDCG